MNEWCYRVFHRIVWTRIDRHVYTTGIGLHVRLTCSGNNNNLSKLCHPPPGEPINFWDDENNIIFLFVIFQPLSAGRIFTVLITCCCRPNLRPSVTCCDIFDNHSFLADRTACCKTGNSDIAVSDINVNKEKKISVESSEHQASKIGLQKCKEWWALITKN